MGQQTRVEVRAIAQGGKFLGNDIGGAEVTVRDAFTGEWIEGGRIAGGSGDTADIMTTPRTWGTPVPVEGSSVFGFALDLVQPRLLEITVHGPLGSLQSARRVTVQQWVAPGMHLVGTRGVQVVIPGQLVEIVAPATHTKVEIAPGLPQRIHIHANVAMMCGCPIGGDAPIFWPVGQFAVTALVYELVDANPPRLLEPPVPMTYAGTASQFHGTWTMPGAGFYEIVVVARETSSNNTGVDRSTVFGVLSAAG